jgi:hypothetical protein
MAIFIHIQKGKVKSIGQEPATPARLEAPEYLNVRI